MSRMIFQSPSGVVEVQGRERAMFSSYVSDIGVGLYHVRYNEELFRNALSADHYLRTSSFRGNTGWADSFEVAARVDLKLIVDNEPIDTFIINLNTVCAIGNDPLKLAARLHAQCEIHAWVDGPNRAWLADIIDTGLTNGIYRTEQGWEQLTEFLRARDDEPVVSSSSVTDGFPNSHTSDWMPAWPVGVPERWAALTEEQQRERGDRQEAWYDLPFTEQWDRGIAHLRTGTGGLELKPDGWDTFHFGSGLTAFGLFEKLSKRES